VVVRLAFSFVRWRRYAYLHTMPNEAPTTLLTIPQAARRLAVSTRTVKRRLLDGSLPVVRLGDGQRDRRIREADLLSFIEARTERRES
jgi:excisionase family DNA binding protein